MSSKTSIKKAPKMSSVARGVLAGLEDAIAYMDGDTSRGRVAYGIDTAAIRQKTSLSQSAFARLLAMQLDGSAIHRLAFGGDGEIDAAWRLLVDLARQKEKPQ